MRHNLTYLFFIVTTFWSCQEGKQNEISNGFDIAELCLIKTCIDSTLRLESGLNTGKYSIDFTLVKTLHRQTIDSFLRANPSVTETNLDSLMEHDSTWTKYQYFDNPVIRFEKIIYQRDGTVLINTSKKKASDGSHGTEIILKRDGQIYKCLKSEITWIS